MEKVCSMGRYTLVAIGNPVFDIIETPYIKTTGRVLSGCSVNAALTVGKLGGKALIIGSIGEDYKYKAESKLRKYGIDAIFLESVETGGFHLIYLDEKMNDRILKIIGLAADIKLNNELRELISQGDSILLGPILGEISVDMALSISNLSDGLIIVDPQGFVRKIEENIVKRVNNPRILEIIRISDVFKPNEHEAETIFGERSPVWIARKIVSLGARIGIVTLAERGSVVATSEGVYRIPAFKTVARDPTGCGDVYGGAFAFYYLKHEDPIEAAVFASATASFMVETTGPDFNIDKSELNERFDILIDMVEKIG